MNIKSVGECCCGCGACNSICPHHAIEMAKDIVTEFLYLMVNDKTCTMCGIYVEVCPVMPRNVINTQYNKCFCSLS